MKNLLAMSLCVLFTAGISYGAIILEHVGDTDPVTEGWARFMYGSTSWFDLGPHSPDAYDETTNAWEVGRMDSNVGRYGYQVYTTPAQWATMDADGWVYTAKVRVTSGPNDVPGSGISLGIYNHLVSGGTPYLRRYILNLGTDADNRPRLKVKSTGEILNLTLFDDGYHTYQVTPAADYATTGNTDVYVDGVLVARDPGLDTDEPGRTLWGKPNDDDFGTALYAYVSLESPGQIIPDPTGRLILTDGGQARVVIVLPEKATKVEETAAQDLQDYLRQISGAVIPINRGDTVPAGAAILVGRSAHAKQLLGGLLSEERLGFDGFVVKTFPKRLVLVGQGGNGTRFAVFAFLEELGCRFFNPHPDGEYIPDKQTIVIDKLDIISKPDFSSRSPWGMRRLWSLTERGSRAWASWYIKNRLGGMSF